MHPRYFIGLSLPETTTNQIQKIQTTLLDGQPVMQPLVPHITLLHPDILMTLSPLYLIPKVKTVSEASMPIEVKLSKTALFDKRVLYIAVDCPALIELRVELVKLLPDDIRARYAIGRDYTPHVTIAQAKPMHSLPDELIKNLKQHLDPLLPNSFLASNLHKFTQKAAQHFRITAV